MLKLSDKSGGNSLILSWVLSGLFLFGCLTAAAQTFRVTGTVKGTQQEPIVGASVVQKGTSVGTTTDSNGKFILGVTDRNATLEVAFLGMKPQAIVLGGGKSHYDIVMENDDVAIGEVVVTALGIKREAKALGYAVSSVGAGDITAGREQNAMQAIVGKVAGVDISTTSAGPSGSTRVLIRGNSQLSGSNLPLYVVDGMVVDNTQLTGAEKWGGYDYGDVLSSINPEDIESISVLKGPSASALYGSMASNGVIMITTKQGTRKEAIGIEFSSNVTIVSLLTKLDDYQREYGMGRNGSLPMSEADGRGTTQVAWGGKLDPDQLVQIYDGRWMPYGNVNNNIFSFFDTGVTLQNTVTFSNATEKTTLRVSASNTHNWDIVPKSTMDRTNITLRGSTRLGKSLSVDVSATYTNEGVENRPALSDNASNIGNSLVGIAPNFDQHWLADNYKDKDGRYYQWNGSDYRFNPYWIINEMRNASSRSRLMGSARVTWDLGRGFKLGVRAGLDTYNFRATLYNPISTPRAIEGSMTERIMNVLQTNYEGTLTYARKFGKFDVNAFVGANILKYSNEMFDMEGIKQVLPGVWSINAFERQSVSQNYPRKEVRSLFASASFGYDGWAYVDATVRNDVSSTLSPNNRSYVYPSVSGSVIFSNLFKHGDWLTFGKVRASWAMVGGDTDPYRLQQDFGLKSFTLNGQSVGQVDPAGGAVPDYEIKPTSTYSIEVGAELKFFNNRLGFDLTYYQQNTRDQIMALPISITTGFPRALINAGEIRNRGIELTVMATPVKGAVTWNTTVTYSKNENRILELHPNVPTYRLAEARWAGAEIQAQEGMPYGVIVGKAIQRTPEGRMIVDSNGLPLFDSNVSVLGNGTFDYLMGWANTVHYKGFTVTALFDAKIGADIYSMSKMQSYYNGTSKETLEGRDAWYASEQDKLSAGSPAGWVATGGYLADGVKLGPVVDGEQTYVENNVYVNPQSYWQAFQDNSPEPFICDASFIKLREVSLTYDLPKKWLRKTPLAGISISVYGRNLLTIYSNVKNIDPEATYNNGNGQGFEYGSLPSRRTYGFGINVKF